MKRTNGDKASFPLALVTGASMGLGKQIALRLAEEGYGVVVNYVSSVKEAETTVKAIGNNSVAIKADIRSALDTNKMAEQIQYRFGRLDAIINNAGITKDNLLLKQTEEEWDEIMGTNLRGCFNVTKIMAPLMIKSGGGQIINISSYSGVKGKAGQAAYSASKAALIGFTFAAAREFSEYNIKVNALLPGFMATEMGMKSCRAMEHAQQNSILHKLSEPEHVAVFVAYLLKTVSITGQVFSLDSRVI